MQRTRSSSPVSFIICIGANLVLAFATFHILRYALVAHAASSMSMSFSDSADVSSSSASSSSSLGRYSRYAGRQSTAARTEAGYGQEAEIYYGSKPAAAATSDPSPSASASDDVAGDISAFLEHHAMHNASATDADNNNASAISSRIEVGASERGSKQQQQHVLQTLEPIALAAGGVAGGKTTQELVRGRVQRAVAAGLVSA